MNTSSLLMRKRGSVNKVKGGIIQLEKERQIVKSMSITNQLLKEGYKLDEVAWSHSSSRHVVFFFKNSDALQIRLKELIEKSVPIHKNR